MTKELGGARIYPKTRRPPHTGAHKINNCIGQALLARRWVNIASLLKPALDSTGSPRPRCAHCLAWNASSIWARRHAAAGAQRIPHALAGRGGAQREAGQRTLKDAINEAMRDWVTNVVPRITFGQRAGSASLPDDGARLPSRHRPGGAQTDSEGRERAAIGDSACVGGGSNAIGVFYDFIKDRDVKLIGVEAGGRGHALGEHAARFDGGGPGVLQGTIPTCFRMKREDKSR